MSLAWVVTFSLGWLWIAPVQQPKKAISPGQVVLLALAPSNDATEPLRNALLSADPMVRRAAARVIGTRGAAGLAPSLTTALAAEEDPETGAEMIRALLLVRPTDGASLAEPHAGRLGGSADAMLAKWRTRGDSSNAAPEGKPDVPVRSVEMWLPGLLESAAQAAGCRLRNDPAFAVASISFRADGRVKRVESDVSHIPKECAPVFHALAATELAPIDEITHEDQQELRLLMINRPFAECTGTPITEHKRIDPSTGIRSPRKIRDVPPQYPEAARLARKQGRSILSATITGTGCVRDVRLLKSAGEPALDVAAAQAVNQWRFEPTIVAGQTIPIVMTVTINFHLR